MTDTIHIRLCENEDVQTYNKTYANEIDRVEEICGNADQETQDSNIEQIRKEEHDTEGKEEEPDIKHAFNADSRQFVANDMDEITLHKTNSNSLKGGESIKHSFHIQDDDETKLKSLSVTVIYSGTFDGGKYNPGVLSVKLNQVSNDCTSSIGHSPPEMQRLNSEHQLSCAAIQHELEETVINGGMFELVVTADSDVNYSISLAARLACPLTKEVKRRLARVVATRDEIKECKAQVSVLDKQLILFERKRRLEDGLINKSKEQSAKSLAEAEKLDLELDYQDDEDEWKSTVAQIEKLKLDSTEACNLTAMRMKMHESLCSDIQKAVEGRDLLQQKMMKLQSKVDADVALLTSVVPNILPDKASEIINILLLGSDDD